MTQQSVDTQVKWRSLAEQARHEASLCMPGKERDKLLKKAAQLETSAQIEGWLNSPDLQPPAGR